MLRGPCHVVTGIQRDPTQLLKSYTQYTDPGCSCHEKNKDRSVLGTEARTGGLSSQYPVWEQEQEAGKACPELGQTYQEWGSGETGDLLA